MGVNSIFIFTIHVYVHPAMYFTSLIELNPACATETIKNKRLLSMSGTSSLWCDDFCHGGIKPLKLDYSQAKQTSVVTYQMFDTPDLTPPA